MGSGAFQYGAPAGAAREVEVVRAMYAAFSRRDIEAALEHVAEDFELLPTGTARLVGRVEPYRGRQGMRDYLTDVGRVWQQLILEADDIRAVAGSVVVFGTVEGVPAAGGEVVRRRALWTWRLREGKAVSLQVNDFAG